jgi:hypothetical protein
VQGGVPIVRHADVKRMLMSMRAMVDAMRALAFREAITMDLAHYGPAEARAAQQARIDLMIPVIKTWMTELGVEVASLGVQVHGGMGYVEETGAAQFWRDARIAPIYEGTNGIQAADLVSRKLGRDGGSTMQAIIAELSGCAARLVASANRELQAVGAALTAAAAEHGRCTEFLLQQLAGQPDVAHGAAFDYTMQTGYLFGGWQLALAAEVAASRLAAGAGSDFHRRKLGIARFYAENMLPRCAGYAAAIEGAAGALMDMPVEWL